MADRALSFCKWPGCNALAHGPYCDEHKPMHDEQVQQSSAEYNRSRGSAAAQGYDARWQAVRLAYMRQHPLCEVCLEHGDTTPAWGVHHKVALKQNGARLDPNNLQSVCFACHERIEGPGRWKRRE